MDQDIKKIKPYIANIRKQLNALAPQLENLTKKSLDEQLLEENSERNKLDISNTYAYILNSLFFSYGKIVGLQKENIDLIRNELNRVQNYMKQTNDYDNKINNLKQKNKNYQNNLKDNLTKSLNNNEPSISTKNFQGKHTKFENDDNKNKQEEENDEEKNSTEYNSNLVNEITERIIKSKSKKDKISKRQKNRNKNKISKA
ncbi:similar to Saccharomyces cerevisiae YHR081W LRP1 Nuclear exosome-associated nucleic acid binding protein [Maudiozyma barnettii]|uniref:Similar to Saccharomyces cerevisiae YHR081W LRP1 Nuclear exosome-associated nucleic acid binding protein n=1 Tax=Maudiozyma barnettii TaxID=61262 RepID=A0A8H2ZEJ6_9SACH|nr:Lrp1p [Kazachstania barnettii]CAB4252341.1 similar to Saccharomyces cerevisiae YHR081W LRP1 Nuclear exosome-associated nucleic acid binding protein [Kazachstania barnettii]CAD1779075.1 similar to Saccharomyces cerevisiae YHR081W LRP1 Nuclear exosome-associated nucleic acid binding protein [Kazachstania barnettii]